MSALRETSFDNIAPTDDVGLKSHLHNDMSTSKEHDCAPQQSTAQASTIAKSPAQSSMEAERGSMHQNNGVGVPPKPASKGPEEFSYSIYRWLRQHPQEEPWLPANRG